MSKQLQILVAVIVAVSIAAGFLLDHLLDGGPVPVDSPAPNSELHNRPAHRIQWPLPGDLVDRSNYLAEGRLLYFGKAGCWNCHKLGTEILPGPISLTAQGPDLGDVGVRLTGDEIFESIINPNAVIAEPKEKYANSEISKMPSMVNNLTADELLKLTVFLSRQTGKADLDSPPLVLPDTRPDTYTPTPQPVPPTLPPAPLAPAPTPAPLLPPVNSATPAPPPHYPLPVRPVPNTPAPELTPAPPVMPAPPPPHSDLPPAGANP